MRILVVDDQQYNRESACVTLIGHEVTVIGNIKEAYEVLSNEGRSPEKRRRFDAVLTDLWLPKGDYRGALGGGKGGDPEDQLPAGLVFALVAAANLRIRTVICTDADHHGDLICSLLDLVGKPSIGGPCGDDEPDPNRLVSYVEARCAQYQGTWDGATGQLTQGQPLEGKPIIKDWLKAMKKAGLFPEIK